MVVPNEQLDRFVSMLTSTNLVALDKVILSVKLSKAVGKSRCLTAPMAARCAAIAERMTRCLEEIRTVANGR